VIIGLAYKKNSSDIRESPALRICRLLHELGASVEIVDTFVEHEPAGLEYITMHRTDNLDYSVFDAAVVITDHDNIDYERIASQVPFVLDMRNRLARVDNVELL
jgi:UDP-N-acetyl-D-glucosamine dehydrogenase